MGITVPPDFREFAQGVKRVWKYGATLPESTRDLFDRLVPWTLLSGITNSAQNDYLYSLIEDIVGLRQVNDLWSLRLKRLLETEKAQLLKTQKTTTLANRRTVNLKLDAVDKLLQRRGDVNRTLVEAKDVVGRMWDAEGDLKAWRKSDRVIDLVTDVAHERGKYKIFDIGFVKATKWIHSCGVGQQVVPPMAQIGKFLAELCGCTEFRRADYVYSHLGGLDEVEMPQVIVEWSPMNARCQELAVELRPMNTTAQVVGDAIHLVMYVRGLLPERAVGRRVTPSTLLAFLKKERVSMESFIDRAYDVEEVPDLTDLLAARLT